jgi:hypothetical protein
MAIDRLEWVGERLTVFGPTSTPQPAPIAPTRSGFAGHGLPGDLGRGWRLVSGRWSVQQGAAMQQDAASPGEARCAVDVPAFVCELSLRHLTGTEGCSRYGVGLDSAGRPILRCSLQPAERIAAICWEDEQGRQERRYALPKEFEPQAYWLLRLEVDGLRVRITLDGSAIRWEGRMGAHPAELVLWTDEAAAAFAGFALTLGWEDLFEQGGGEPAELGWRATGTWLIRDQRLWHPGDESQGTVIKGPPLESYELVVNARLVSVEPDGFYGVYPALLSGGEGPLLTIQRRGFCWAIVAEEPKDKRVFPLPEAFDPHIDQQLRFRKERNCLAIRWEEQLIGTMEAPEGATEIGLYAHRAVTAFDMVRVTAIQAAR